MAGCGYLQTTANFTQDLTPSTLLSLTCEVRGVPPRLHALHRRSLF
jgi:hypothetical protein